MSRFRRHGAASPPVPVLHGAQDPHPGPLIRARPGPRSRPLVVFERVACGHHPWIDRGVREDFFRRLEQGLAARARGKEERG